MDAHARRELNRRKESFILRRTAELNAKFLPPLHSYVVFCRPTPLQARHQCELWITQPSVIQHTYFELISSTVEHPYSNLGKVLHAAVSLRHLHTSAVLANDIATWPSSVIGHPQ